jgi:hypothetical protein
MTPERFAGGLTFDDYVTFSGSPANLAREGFDIRRFSYLRPRLDWSQYLRDRHARARLTDEQTAAIRWLAAQPGGPARVLVIAEDWSSDCRRDVPMLARLAEAGGLEMRIFNRDGARFARDAAPSPAESPNADLMAQFLNTKEHGTFQSIPVGAFFTGGFEYLYHYTEYPAIYHTDRIVYGHIRVPRADETPDETRARIDKEFGGLQQSPFFRIWACAGADEIISALHRRLVIGEV